MTPSYRDIRTSNCDCRWRVPAALCLLLAVGGVGAQDDPFALDEPVESTSDPERAAELTQVRSEIEIGQGHVSDDSFRFGRYSGLEQQGGYTVLNFDLQRRNAYDADEAFMCRVQGRNLGIDSRQLSATVESQGSYQFRFDYDQIPSHRSSDGRTVFTGVGGTRLGLPVDWVGGANTAGMTRLLPNLQSVEIEQERQRLGFGLSGHLPRNWTFETSFTHEEKDGLKTIGAVIGNSGGNPRAAILPEPVDYQTRQFDVVLGYADPDKQLRIGYYLSLFDNANSALIWRNPYTTIGGWQASAGFPSGEGSISLPPDNEFHQFSIGGGYNMSSDTRLSGDVSSGRMRQNDTFLPYTINPVLAASITQPLPRNSLDGQIDTTAANLRMSSRIGDSFRWNAGYRYDDRDNQTPRNEYVYIGGDSQTQDVSATSSRRRFNEPYSYREHKFMLAGSYELGHRTHLTAGFDSRDIERDYSEREQAQEDTFSLGLRSNATDWMSAGLRWSRSERDGSTYHGDEPFVSGYSSAYVATVAGGWENAPGLRKFHLADRERDKASLYVNLMPAQEWAINLALNRVEDDYNSSELGLTQAQIDSASIDVLYAPDSNWSAYAFGVREEFDSAQNGVSITGGTREADAINPARAWTALHGDRVDTWGLGYKHKLIENALDLEVEYVASRSDTDIVVTTGSALTSAPLPTLTTDLQSLRLTLNYKLRSNMSLRAHYWLEDYESSDWALDGVAANQLANVILLGESSPDYRVHVTALSLVYRF